MRYFYIVKVSANERLCLLGCFVQTWRHDFDLVWWVVVAFHRKRSFIQMWYLNSCTEFYPIIRKKCAPHEPFNREYHADTSTVMSIVVVVQWQKLNNYSKSFESLIPFTHVGVFKDKYPHVNKRWCTRTHTGTHTHVLWMLSVTTYPFGTGCLPLLRKQYTRTTLYNWFFRITWPLLNLSTLNLDTHYTGNELKPKRQSCAPHLSLFNGNH